MTRRSRLSTATRTLSAAIFCWMLTAASVATAQKTELPSGTSFFRRGDTNADGTVDLSDGLATLRFLFLGGDRPGCMDASDADDSGEVELTDASYTFSFLFLGGAVTPEPGLECGPDKTADRLACLAYDACAQDPDKDLDDPLPWPKPVAEPRLSLRRGGALDLELSVVSEFTLEIPAGTAIEFETTNLSQLSDPVLHLFAGASPVDLEELEAVAVDDDGGEGLNAKIRYSATHETRLQLVVRATGPDSAGTCSILRDGQPWQDDVEFGGAFVTLRSMRQEETIDTVRVPNGAGGDHRAYVLELDQFSVDDRVFGDGLAGALFWKPARSSVVIFGVTQQSLPGLARVVRNDAKLPFHDRDGDGLGVELEEDLGLCDALFGPATGTIPEWRLDILEARFLRLCEEQASTDQEADECQANYLQFLDERTETTFDCAEAVDPRDTDGDGIRDAAEVIGVKGVQPQLLPLWGADPRHKDMFVEVDFKLLARDEEPQQLSPEKARTFAGVYQDDIGIFSSERRSAHADSLRNPDQLPGIDVHMDTGVEPEVPEDATTYGDWGGYDVVPLQRSLEDGLVPAKPTQAWKSHMSSFRYGVFRYMLPYAGGGGQNPINHLTFTGGINSPLALVHESGHANGLGHGGPHRSELRGVNCKPNYVSIQNYAYLYSGRVGFSDGAQAPLNNTVLNEWEAVAPEETEYINLLKNTFRYYVDEENGHVDWNRDGEFAPAGVTVRAQANSRPFGSCEGNRANAIILEDATTNVSPALARLDGRLYLFHALRGIVSYRTSTSSWNCAQHVPSDETCGTWGGPKGIPLNAVQGIDAERIGAGGDEEILVVANSSGGQLVETRLTIGADGNDQWSDRVPLPGVSRAVGEPSLVRLSDCETYLAYKDEDGRVILKRHTASGWEEDEVAVTENGTELAMWEHASPGIGRGELAWSSGAPALYGAFADANGVLRLYGYDPDTRQWESTGMLETPGSRVGSRPSIAWVEGTSEWEPGRLYLAYAAKDMNFERSTTEQTRLLIMLQSYTKVETRADGTLQRTPRVGLSSYFDNVWLDGFGIDLFHEAGVDANLRAAFPRASWNPDKPQNWMGIRFRPMADSLTDYTYSDHDDWEALRVGICQNVVNPGDLINDPIECPVPTWHVKSRRGGEPEHDHDDEGDEDLDKRELLEEIETLPSSELPKVNETFARDPSKALSCTAAKK